MKSKIKELILKIIREKGLCNNPESEYSDSYYCIERYLIDDLDKEMKEEK